MNIQWSSISFSSLHSLLKDVNLSSLTTQLTTQQQKIIAIAVAVLGCLSISYVIARSCYFKAKKASSTDRDGRAQERIQLDKTSESKKELFSPSGVFVKPTISMVKTPENSYESNSPKDKNTVSSTPEMENSACKRVFTDMKNLKGDLDKKLPLIVGTPVEVTAQDNASHPSSPTEVASDDGMEVYIKEIEKAPNNPKNYKAYTLLAKQLKNNHIPSIQLLGKEMNPRDLYIRSIELNPNYPLSYCNLGTLLPKGESVRVGDDEMTAQQLYLKAIELDPQFLHAYTNLMATLDPDQESIQLLNGEMKPVQEFVLTIVNLQPEMAMGYYKLAKLLKTESTQLLNGTMMTRKELCCKAIELDPKLLGAYRLLGGLLNEQESIEVPNYGALNSESLYILVKKIYKRQRRVKQEK